MAQIAFQLPNGHPQYLQGDITSSKENPGFTITTFDLNNEVFIEGPATQDPISIQPILIPCTLESTPKEKHIQHVQTAVEDIRAGKLKKVVLSRVKVIDKPQGFDLQRMFQLICKTYPAAFNYVLHSETTGCWIGATPEILYSQENGTGQTMALAGTLPIGRGNWTNKELVEQRVVKEAIEEKLNAVGIAYTVSDVHDQQAGNIRHLCNDFSIDPGHVSAREICRTLHPTPAICGTPTTMALKEINELETHNRELYCGYLGYRDEHNNASYFVNLRCMQVFEDKLVLYLGGGINAQSDPEKEWEETELKARTLLDLVEKM